MQILLVCFQAHCLAVCYWHDVQPQRVKPSRAYIFAAVSGAEDPEKMLDQAVNEMQNDLVRLRQASAQVTQFHLHIPRCMVDHAWSSDIIAFM